MTAFSAPRSTMSAVFSGDDLGNILTGGADDDALDGGGGDDTLDGGGGADILSGGDGDDSFLSDGLDTINGGDGYDSVLVILAGTDGVSLDLSGVGGIDTVSLATGGSLDQVETVSLIATDGDDNIVTPASGGEVYGAGGNDIIAVTGDAPSSGTAILIGGDGNDSLTAGLTQDWLFGGAGDDVIDGGFGNDHIGAVDEFLALISSADSAGALTAIAGSDVLVSQDQTDTGADTLDGGFGDDVIYGWAGNDTLIGGFGVDTLNGGDGDDLINGFEGGLTTDSDLLDGQVGDDVIEADSSDQVNGGDGYDLASIHYDGYANNGGSALALDLSTVMDGDILSLDGGGSVRNVEALRIYATAGDDTIIDAAWDGQIHGGDGTDTLSGRDGNDILDGGNGDDSLNGDAGNDYLSGGDGTDTLRGGMGDDTYVVDANDRIIESNNQGTDTIISGATFSLAGRYIENLTLNGNGNFNAYGNGFANVLAGNDGANTLNGGRNADIMSGDGGNDLYFVDNAGDVVTEDAGGGKDAVYASISYALAANVETLALIGYQAINATGNALDNALTGNGNVNALDGGAGNDILRGQGGNDVLTGGDGADSFAFSAAGSANGLDHITDFASGSDKLWFTGSDYGFARGHALTAAEFHTGPASDDNGQFLYNTVNHTLYWDADGTGATAAVAVAVFDNAASLNANDFLFL